MQALSMGSYSIFNCLLEISNETDTACFHLVQTFFCKKMEITSATENDVTIRIRVGKDKRKIVSLKNQKATTYKSIRSFRYKKNEKAWLYFISDQLSQYTKHKRENFATLQIIQIDIIRKN